MAKKPLSETASSAWEDSAHDFATTSRVFKGLEAGDIKRLLSLRRISGMTRTSRDTLAQRFDSESDIIPVQLVLLHDMIPMDTRFLGDHSSAKKSVAEYPQGSSIAYLGGLKGMYGCSGIVTGYKNGQLKVTLEPHALNPSFAKQIIDEHPAGKMIPSYIVAKKAGIDNMVLAQISSSVFVKPMNIDVGLNLRFAKKELVVASLVQMELDGEGKPRWNYSTEALSIILEYKRTFPELFEMLNKGKRDFSFSADSIPLPDDGKPKKVRALEYVESVDRWLKSLPSSNLPLVSVNSSVLPLNVIEKFESAASLSLQKSKGFIETIVPVTEVYKPSRHVWSPTEKVYPCLGDRVSYLCGLEGVPFGTSGTIIGIHPQEKVEETMVDVVFDVQLIPGSTLHSLCSQSRGLSLQLKQLLNLTQSSLSTPDGNIGSSKGQPELSPVKTKSDESYRVEEKKTVCETPQVDDEKELSGAAQTSRDSVDVAAMDFLSLLMKKKLG